MRRLLLIASILLFLAGPVTAQGPIYLPLLSKVYEMPAPKSTLGIVSPIEAQNYVLNPSAETTGNFAAVAGTTVNRMTSYQKYGIYAYEVDTNADNEGITLTLLAFASEPAYITMRARGTLPASWDWSLDNVNYHEPRLLEKIDPNWSLYGVQIPASQASGATTLYVRQKGAGSGFFYLDGVQVSPVIEGRYYSTYIDGAQEGCRWLGAPHASASLRSGQSRAGGIVRDFYRDYGFVVEKMIGAGSVTEELAIDSYALLPGGELNNSKIQPREFSLVGYFLADTEEALHENVQRLELEMGLDTYPSRQPFRLRFSGAKVLKEIKARYAGGLEGELPVYYDDCLSVEDEKWVNNRFFKARAAVQMVAEDPFWYEVGESSTLLDTLASDTFRVVAGRLMDGGWSSLGPPGAGGTYTAVIAIAENDVYIYFGGIFSNFDGIAAADNIVRYNKQTGVYSAIDAGLNGAVMTMAFTPSGSLIVGGQFTNASGVAAADYVAVLAAGATTFTALGVPVSGTAAITIVNAVVVDTFGNIIIGGDFDDWANVALADNVVMWNGSAYVAMGSGFGDSVSALAIGNGKVYAGGSFITTGIDSVPFIAEWDYSTWESLGPGLDNLVLAIVVNSSGLVFAGGSFVQTGDNLIDLNFVGAWDGTAWRPLGGGVNGDVRSLGIGHDGILFLAGSFTEAGTLTLADRLALWNGYSYAHLDIDLPGSPVFVTIYPSLLDIDPVVPQNYALYLGFDPVGTGSFAGDEAINNAGSISAFPQIVFNRLGGDGATIQSIKNERTGKGILFDYPLLDGETLVVDLNPKSRTIISSFFGPVWRATLPGGQLSTWQLLPGDNQISTFVSESGSPSVMAYILWKDVYRSYH